MFLRKKRMTGRFVEPAVFEANLKKQLELAPLTLSELQKHGVSPDTLLRLEFFFYAISTANAQALEAALGEMAYQVQTGPAAHDRRQLLVNGWSTPIPMTRPSILDWTEKICRLAFRHDCVFDGWGTLLDQSQIPSAAPGQLPNGA